MISTQSTYPSPLLGRTLYKLGVVEIGNLQFLVYSEYELKKNHITKIILQMFVSPGSIVLFVVCSLFKEQIFAIAPLSLKHNFRNSTSFKIQID